jgi:predicted DNA-binding transcriptional regulator
MKYDFNPKRWSGTYVKAHNDLLACPGLTPGEKLVYARLIDHFQITLGCACVRHSVLCDELGMSERTVRRNISKLATYGLIKIEVQKSERSGYQPNRYRFSDPTLILETLSVSFEDGESDDPKRSYEALRAQERLGKGKADQAVDAQKTKVEENTKTIMERTLSELVGEDNIAEFTKAERAKKNLPPSHEAVGEIVIYKATQGFRKSENAVLRPVKNVVSVLQKIWKTELKQNGFGFNKSGRFIVPDWRGIESAHIIQLLDKYCGNDLEIALKYLVRYWHNISERYLKGSGVAPTLSFLLRFHDSIMPEAQQYERVAGVLEEYKKWEKANPTNPRPPEDLLQRYTEAQELLSKLGQ